MNKKKIIPLVAGILSASIYINTGFASPSGGETFENGESLGELHFKNPVNTELLEKQKEANIERERQRKKNLEFDVVGRNAVGQMSIVDDVKKKLVAKGQSIKWPTAEASKIISELKIVTDAQNSRNFEIAANKAQELYLRYPEFEEFRKWEGFYRNRNHEYDESSMILDSLPKERPLNEALQKDMPIKIYRLDNYINMERYDDARRLMAEIKDNVLSMKDEQSASGLTTRKFYSILLMYESLMLDYAQTGDINKKKLDKVWESIPKSDRYNLDVFYGFNIDDLGYLYGKYYSRKDVLKRYVQQEEPTTDKKTIKQIKDAKSIIRNKT